MGKFARLVFVAAVTTLLGLTSWPAHAEQPPESGLSLEVSATQASYAPDEPVELTFTVTNRGKSPCRVATLPDATVQLLSVRHGGTPVSPSFARGYYGDGLSGSLRRSLREVAPGASVSFTIVGLGEAEDMSLKTATQSPAGGALISWWPVGAGGRYDLAAGYAMPQGAEPGLCAGATNVATVSFAVGGTPAERFPWLLVGGIGAALVVGVVVTILVVRRSRRRTTGGAAAVVAVLLAMGIVIAGSGGTARAANKVVGDKAFKAAVAGCFKLFETNDPWGIMKAIKDPKQKGRVTIKPYADEKGVLVPDGVSTTGETPLHKDGEKSSMILWNPKAHENGLEYEPGNPIDNCASLYHELAHAEAIMTGAIAKGDCGDTGISNEEVRATYAENDYLSKLGKSRSTYNGQPLPPRVMDLDGKPTKQLPKKCEETKPEPHTKNACTDQPIGLRKPMGALRVAQDCTNTSAQTNGDPHLTTFDQYSYDFQAVGEFVTAKSGNDFEVQTRQGPVPHLEDRTVSVNSAAAFRVGSDGVGVYVDNGVLVVRVNGQAETIVPGERKLPGGGVLTRRAAFVEGNPDGYTITWPDRSVAELDAIGYWGIRLLLSLSQQHKGKVSGLLGNFDGNKDNELSTRDGKPVAQPAQFEQLYKTFGDSWRIRQDESLFDYPQGESTEKFTDRAFPEREKTINDLTEAQREQGKVACQLAGVTDPTLLDQCILDVALTGQASFAVNAGDTQAILPGPKEPAPGPVDPGGTVRDGDVVKGRIDAPGERDAYQLDLGEATEFQFADQTGDISIEAETPGSWKRALTTDADEIAENSPQAKRFVVSKPDNTTGEYSFRVVTHKHRRFDVKIGDRIGPGGVPGTGRLDVPGRVDIYALDAGSASSIELTDAEGCYYWVGITEDAPDSNVPTPYPFWPELGESGPPCSSIPINIEPNKRFLLAVWFPEAKTLDYGFRIEAR